MNEAEWLDWAGDPGGLLRAVRDTASDRKLRLFACACCRRIWAHITDDRCRAAVEAAEAFADGIVDVEALQRAHAAAGEAVQAIAGSGIFTPAEHSAVATLYCLKEWGIISFAAANRAASSLLGHKEAEQRTQCDLFRDIFGNPFSPLATSREVVSPSVASLARAIYVERSFDRMSELADTLHQEGFKRADVIEHCRTARPHVRGCWVLDLLLGRN